MATFQKVKLGDICLRITDGKHGDCINENNSGYYFISSKDVFGGSIHYENARQITEADFFDTHRRTKLESGDILVTNSGTIGRMALVKANGKVEKTTFQKSVAIIKPKQNVVDSHYLYYKLLSLYKQLVNLGGGSAQHNLLLGDLRNFSVEIPDILTQIKIGSVLSAYDDLIENNEKRIRALEEMAQLLYTEWFVKFQFPRLRQGSGGQAGHEKVKMVDSGTEYGVIPEGWEVKRLGDLIKVKKGKNITQDTVVHGDVPVVAGGLEPAYFHDTPNTKSPVVTISASGANAGFTRLYFEDVWASDCSFIDLSVTPYVYFHYLFLINNQDAVSRLQRGSAQPHVYPKDLMDLKMLEPPEGIISEFSDLVSPLFKLVGGMVQKNQNLSKTRNLLIPQLVTGKRMLK